MSLWGRTPTRRPNPRADWGPVSEALALPERVRFNTIPHPWPPGPWSEEPDDVDGVDPRTQYVYALRRNDFGVWCGYVCVPRRHPWHGRRYDDLDVVVHGGLTFADSWIARDAPQEGAWWFGFDCGHGWDVIPALRRATGVPFFPLQAEYRSLSYARGQVRRLARQLAAVEGG